MLPVEFSLVILESLERLKYILRFAIGAMVPGGRYASAVSSVSEMMLACRPAEWPASKPSDMDCFEFVSAEIRPNSSTDFWI
jgi:hypothetical protein